MEQNRSIEADSSCLNGYEELSLSYSPWTIRGVQWISVLTESFSGTKDGEDEADRAGHNTTEKSRLLARQK